MRPIIFHPKARDAIRQFPKDARSRLGRNLFRLQLGEELGIPHSRPMPVVAPGVHEIRVHSRSGAYRTFYYAASAEGILVIHAFTKKTQRTPPREVEAARKQIKELTNAQTETDGSKDA